MSLKLVVSDLDGTLLTPEHRVGEYSLRVLRRVRERGLDLVLASGRHFQDVRAVSQVLGGGTCTISSNGAAVYGGSGQLLEMESLDPACLEFLVSDPAFGGVHTNLYRPHDWLVERPEPRLLAYHVESGFSYRLADFGRLDHQPVLKVFYYGENGELLELERYILERFGDLVSTTFALPFTLEVMAKGVSKGAAFQRVCARRGIDPCEAIAFGDGMNDLEMLRAAGVGVLMGNADPGLKAALPGNPVIGGSDEEAVARYLEQMFPEA
jgi:Cof subfamily protein (haloacid dehalogenase superfamily)